MFTDPIAQAIIQNPKTGQEWKWDAPDFPFLTGLTLSYEYQRSGAITINIDAPYEDGIKKLLTPPTPFANGNIIQARIGYASGNFTPWSMGMLLEGGDQISIDSNGVSGGVTFGPLARSAFYTVDKEILNLSTDIERLEFVATQMGLNLILSPDAEAWLKETGGVPGPWQSMSAWEILKQICSDSNMRWYIGADPLNPEQGTRNLIIVSKGKIDQLYAGLLRRSYVIRGVVDVGKNQYPCFGWSPEAAAFAMWLANPPNPASGGVQASYIPSDDGKVKNVKVEPKDQEVKVVGHVATDVPTDHIFDGRDVFDKTKTDEEMAEELFLPGGTGADGEAKAKKVLLNRQDVGNPAQNGVITTIGLPEESTGYICELVGGGSVYDGPYEVMKMTHTYTTGSWEMALTVRRQGTGGKDKSSGVEQETREGQLS